IGLSSCSCARRRTTGILCSTHCSPAGFPRSADASAPAQLVSGARGEDCNPAHAQRAGLGYARRMNRLLLLTFALAGLAVALSPAVAQAQAHADTILVDGKVWTGNPAQPEAEAIAILDGKVAAVGSDAEVRRWAGPATEVLELRG